MGSVHVGIILMLACEIVAGTAYLSLPQKWDAPRELSWEETRVKCRCEPPANEDGSMCEPVSLLDRYGIAWQCDLKPRIQAAVNDTEISL